MRSSIYHSAKHKTRCLHSGQLASQDVDVIEDPDPNAGVELEDKLPEHEYRDLFKPEDRLHITVSHEHENLNTKEYLDSLQQKLFSNLSR